MRSIHQLMQRFEACARVLQAGVLEPTQERLGVLVAFLEGIEVTVREVCAGNAEATLPRPALLEKVSVAFGKPAAPRDGAHRGKAGDGVNLRWVNAGPRGQASEAAGGARRRAMTAEGKARVLVIDDSDVVRALLEQHIAKAGYEVYGSRLAIGATHLILSKAIDVVIADVSMPGLSGDRLVGVLRRNPRLRDLIIVIMSERSQRELEQITRGLDIQAVLAKGDVHARLVPLLEELLKARAVGGGAKEAKS